MNDALTQEPAGPQTDTLVEQKDTPRPVEVKTSEPPKSLDDTLRENVDKAVKESEAPKPKPEKADKVGDAGDKKADTKADDADAKPDEDQEDTAKDDTANDKAKAKPVTLEEPVAKAPPKPTAYRDPPSGFDDAAKAEWDNVPENVRGAFHRRVQEMERGIEKYRPDAQEYETVRQYADMAKQSGTDLPTALNRYVQMESALRQDPISGMQAVVANLGLKKPDGTAVTLRDFAARIMGQSPDQAASRQEAENSELRRELQEIKQKVGGFSQRAQQQDQQAKVSAAENDWGAFQRENSRAAELEPQIAEFLHKYPAPANIPTRERLADAYAYATARNPQSVVHTDPSPLVQTQTAPKPNPAGQKSISGTGGESQTVRKQSSDELIKKAIAKMHN